MAWYSNTVQSLEPGKKYTRNNLIALLQEDHPSLSKNSFHWAIGGMLQSGMLVRSGYDSYYRSESTVKPIYIPTYTMESLRLIDFVENAYPDVRFTVIETVLLNEFLNHLVAQNTVFLQVEKDAAVFIFRFLQEETKQKVLFKPTRKEYNLYWEKEGIVVTELVSEAPVFENRPHYVCIEKLLVDLYCDKLLSMTYSKAEYGEVIAQAVRRYTVDRSKMTRYARRRNKNSEIMAFLDEAIGKRE